MACASPSSDYPDVPDFVQGWVRSLLDPELLTVLRDAGNRQIEIRLYVHKGRIRRRPALLLDAGSQEMVDPGDVT
jgi:hypothetical protein